MTRRPLGLTVTCLLLGWFAIAGFMNALVLPHALQSALASDLLRAKTPLAMSTLVLMAALYGVTALAAAVAIWRMLSWGPRAFLAWALVACAFMIVFATVVRLPPDTPLILLVAFVTFLVLLLWAWWSNISTAYVRAERHEL